MDNSLIYWNTKGEKRYYNNQFREWVSCILNINRKKANYLAIGSWDGTVKIFNNEYNIIREIPGGNYAITSLSTDDDGEYLFIAYKDGTIKEMNIENIEHENENDAK